MGLRIGIRSIPVLTENLGSETNLDFLTLQAFRGLLTLGCSTQFSTPDIQASLRKLAHKNAFNYSMDKNLPVGFGKSLLSTDWAVRCSELSENDTASSVHFAHEDAIGGAALHFNGRHKLENLGKFAALDAMTGETLLGSMPLWCGLQVPDGFESAIENFGRITRKKPEWAFWWDWFQSFLVGQPLDWEVQREVALIDDSVWEDGPEAVAAAIRDIRRNAAGPAPLEEKVLRKHVEYLLKNPVLSEATALNGAETIERAIADYLREAPANCLPEDLIHLEALPQHFRAIARVIGSETNDDQKENQLLDQISKLHARVAELEKELAVSKNKELKGIISQEAAKSFGKTIGSPLFWSGAAVSVGYFFGVAPSDLTLENFRNYVEELLRANAETAPPAQPPLPSSIDV